MSTIVESLGEADTAYDYVIVGGGTAGCVVAARLAESLPDKRILVIEGGGSDYKNEIVLDLKRMVDLWGTEMDYCYYSVVQPNGMYGKACRPEGNAFHGTDSSA
jgi:choline dehydrogenase-like flavoprotein